MENDNETNKEGNQELGTASDYLNVIKDLKQNSVSKEDYDKLREENKMLLDTIANNVPADNSSDNEPEQKVDIDKLREELFSSDDQDITNLDYITKVLQLRKAIMDKGGKDPFLPSGQNILPTDDDIATAERVAEVYQHCVDVADGNPDIFTQELQRVTVDVAPQIKKR